MPATLTTFNAMMKDVYIDPVVKALNEEIAVFSRLGRAKMTWNGRQGICPVHVGRNDGVWFNAAGLLPTAGNQSYVDLTITRKNLYVSIQLDGELFDASSGGSRAAFMNAVDSEINGAVSDVARFTNRTSVSGGRTVGFLAEQKTDVGGGTTWDFDGDYTKLNAAITIMGGTVELQFIRMDTYAALGAVTGCTAAVAATGLITLDGNLDTTAAPVGTLIAVRFADVDIAALLAGGLDIDGQMVGIYGNLAEPTHFAENRTTATGEVGLQADSFSIMPAAARVAITRAALDDLNARIFNSDFGGSHPDWIWMNALQCTNYSDSLTGTAAANPVPNARVEVGKGNAKWDAGYTGLAHSGVPLEQSRDVDNGLLLAMTEADWKIAEHTKYQWSDKTGAIWTQIPGEDRFRAFGYKRFDLVCKAPGRSSVVGGFTL